MNIQRNKRIGAVHYGKKQLGLDEDTYRAMLERITGKSSSAQMDDRELALVLDEMRRLGVTRRKPFVRSKSALVRKVWATWTAMGNDGIVDDASRPALRAFVKRQANVDDPEWLDDRDANTVIEALKQWRARVERERTEKT